MPPGRRAPRPPPRRGNPIRRGLRFIKNPANRIRAIIIVASYFVNVHPLGQVEVVFDCLESAAAGGGRRAALLSYSEQPTRVSASRLRTERFHVTALSFANPTRSIFDLGPRGKLDDRVILIIYDRQDFGSCDNDEWNTARLVLAKLRAHWRTKKKQ